MVHDWEIPAPPYVYPTDILANYAHVLLWGLSLARRAPLRKSDLVVVRYDLPALPLAEALVERLHVLGLVPVPQARPSARMERDQLMLANNKRLAMLIPGERELAQAMAASITCISPQSQTHLNRVDPANLALLQASRRPIQEILSRRELLGEYGWTLGVYPCQALADQAGLSLEDYADQVRLACRIGRGSPLNEWRLFERDIRLVQEWLNSMPLAALRVQSERMDMLIPLGERRRWIALTGRNIPSFECYISPDWRGVEGRFAVTLPTYRAGARIDGLTLDFRQGQIVALNAQEGRDFALEQVAMDAGASRLGEFALVDKRFSPINKYMATTLFDENFGGDHGSCHIALGQSYANSFDGDPATLTRDRREELGFNMSALHWDLVNTEDKRVVSLLRGGGKQTLYEHGQFTL